MKRNLLFSLPVLALILLSACQTGGQTETVAAAPTFTPQSTIQMATEPDDTPGCSVVNTGFAPQRPPNSPFPDVSASDWRRGPADAPITIIEYGDFQ